jgi:hypothetical protein
MKWLECKFCDREYKVLSDSMDLAEYCPFCGEQAEIEDEEEEYDNDYNEI